MLAITTDNRFTMHTLKKILLFLGFLLPSLTIVSQVSTGGLPPSFSHKNLKSQVVIPTLTLNLLNVDKLLNEDKTNGTPYRYGVIEKVQLDIKSGIETQLDSGHIWRYEITSNSAKSLKLLFKQFVIPARARLYVYNSDYSITCGAFTSANMNTDSSFVIADFPDKKLLLEYYEPSNPEFSGKLIINKISQAYRNLAGLMTAQADSGYIDVNCREGIDWQLEKHAVCLYTFISDTDSYLCSGGLINNATNDGTPYFLTANHCISTSDMAASVTAYFNYETKGCGMEGKLVKTLSGASLQTAGKESDFTLLRFSSVPPASYQPYYAGWDLTDTASYAVGIHHPAGLLKKISIDNDPPFTYPDLIIWKNNTFSQPDTHWHVYFDKGKIAGGSSGSPLFNQQKRIMGQLHGGEGNESFYGKFNYSWNHSDSISANELKKYLVGDNAITCLNGYTPSDNIPEAIFTTEYEYVCLGSPIQITDHSLFNVSSWKWQFTPSTITFLNNTSPNSQQPVVSFNEAGTYDIKLIVGNSYGEDSVTHSSAIIAGSEIRVAYLSNTQSESCLNKLDSIVVTASGASSYTWKLNDTSIFELKERGNSQAVIKLKTGVAPDSTVYVRGKVIGKQGSCSDSCNFIFQLTLPYNDNIEHARLLGVGQNGPFSNICASVEQNEPIPPVDNTCTSQTSWCDEYGNGSNVVEHSVWFYFYGPKSGAVSIEANDMDGQIALYNADSYQDILNGRYTLMAANDDIAIDKPFSKINKIDVTPDKIYWLQFDGSYGGAEGKFHIVLNEETPDSTNAVKSIAAGNKTRMTFYPQPASDYLEIKSDCLDGLNNVQIRIYDVMGNLLFSREQDVRQNRVTANLESNWANGIYVVSVIGKNTVATGRFIKQKN